MRSREVTLLGLILAIDLLTHITGAQGFQDWVMVYLMASLIFLYLPSPGWYVIGIVIFDIARHVLYMMMTYGWYIGYIRALLITFDLMAVTTPEKVFLTFLIFIPLQKIVQLYLAKWTIERLHLRERVGK